MKIKQVALAFDQLLNTLLGGMADRHSAPEPGDLEINPRDGTVLE